ncbi:MAG: sugar transferase [Stenotrophomonas acidaminiphila]|nr:MAG: sugar transferase [Stenotrophomonas acidaminiphila]
MAHAFASRTNRVTRVLWLLEVAILLLAVAGAAWLRFLGDDEGRQVFLETGFIRGLIFALVITVSMVAFGLYQPHVRHTRIDFAIRIVLSFVFGAVGLLVLYYLAPMTHIGRTVFMLALLLGLLGVCLLRASAYRLIGFDAFKRRILVYGAGKNADLINRRMRRRSDRQSFVVVGFLPVKGQETMVSEDLLITGDERLPELTARLEIDEILIAPDERRGGLPMEDILACAQAGVSVVDLPVFFEREAGLIKLEVVDPSSLVFAGGFDHSLPRRLSKRFFDVMAALLLLLVAWPAMLLVALCVRLEGTGSTILYRQVRVGEGGRSFNVVKFRSMRTDAEKDGVARWATANDDRTTRVGRFIRQTRLDELPQLFNVLAGDMSFVGPRPERPQFVDQLNSEIRYYSVRHSVKPGLTGWAQLRYPYGASVKDAEEKLKFDLFYVKNHGLVFDLMILLQTVEVVLFRRGGR